MKRDDFTYSAISIELFEDDDHIDILILYDKERDIFIVKKWRPVYTDKGYCGGKINLFVYNAKEMKSIYNWS